MEILNYAEKFADHVQLNIDKEIDREIQIKNNKIKSFSYNHNSNFTLKVWIDGKEGRATSNALNLDLANKAIKIAKNNTNKEYFYGIPSLKKYNKPKTFDKSVEELNENTMIQDAKEIIKKIAHNNVMIAEGDINANVSESFIYNSNGIELNEKSSSFGIGVESVANKNGKVSSWYETEEKNKYFDNFGDGVNEKTLLYLNKQKYEGKTKTVTLSPEVFSSLLHHCLLTNFNGKNVEKHKSLFCDKLNQKVTSDEISIFDDGLKNDAMGSFMFDGEGTPSQKTCLVDKGELKKFIYDFNTAKHNNTETTGNSFGNDIDFSNIIIEGKEKNTENGIFVESIIGAHLGNSLTSDFSVTAEHAIFENKPVSGVMISGKVIDILNNVLSIEKKQEEKNGVIMGNISSDSINIIN